MTRFEKVAAFAKSHWGLTLVKNDSTSLGWWNGCWKTGYGLSGNFPGFGHSHRRYTSLKQVEQFIGFSDE